MKEIMGTCKFCGQGVMVAVPDEATDEEIQEEAVMYCKCLEAHAYREQKEKEEQVEMAKESAKGTIFELFHEEHPGIETIMNEALDLIVKNGYQITITTRGKTKAKIKYSKETIKVEREDKHTYVRETEV